MKRCSYLMAKGTVLLFAALAGLVALSRADAQSPFFPNTTPVYGNSYGTIVGGNNGPFYRGVQLPLKPLPAVYSQPLPAPPPSVMAQFGAVPYATGGRPNISVFNSPATYPPPARNPNWAPNFSSR